MKPRTVKQLKAVVGKYVRKWKQKLWLHMWHIDCVYRTYVRPSEDTPDGMTVTASTRSAWMYFTATIDFSIDQLADMEENDIEKIVIHELLHIVVNEMREDGIDHEERVVSHLSTAIEAMGETK